MWHEIQGDVERRKRGDVAGLQAKLQRQCLRDNGMETASRFKYTLLGMTSVVRRADREETYTREVSPAQQNMHGSLSQVQYAKHPRGYTKVPFTLGRQPLTSWGLGALSEAGENYRPLENFLHTISEKSHISEIHLGSSAPAL